MRIQRYRLNPILRVEFAFISCVISVLLLTPHVWCQAPEKEKTQTPPEKPEIPHTLKGTVEIGAQALFVQGSHTAKFQETRDVPKGFFVPKLMLDFSSANSPYFVSLRGLEVLEDDQRFTADAGKFGKYRMQFLWDQIPHAFGDGKSFLVYTAPGLYQVSASLRARLQPLTTPETLISPTSVVANIIRQELETAPVTEVKLRRDQSLFRQSYWPSDRVELYFQFNRLRTTGSRPMSAGTFVRRPVPGGGLADTGGRWEGLGQEYLEPLDQRTTDLEGGVKFTGRKWTAGADYAASFFRNFIDSLTFENPFRVTDEQGCTPNPLRPGTLTCGASNRFRQVRWQNDLPPNNNAHTVNLWGNLDVTPNTQLRGLFSLAYWTQDDDFLAWTLNSAIRPRDWDQGPPPSSITNALDVSQLPAPSPNAKMRNINHDYALVNRSKNTFRFQAEYRSQDVDNQTPEIVFPGYAAFGDSTWRAARTDFYNLPIENLDWDFRRQNATAGFQWDVVPQLTWKLDYDWEVWNRKFRDVNRNNEHSIRNRVDLNTDAGVNFRADYQYSNRQATNYNTQPLTFNPNLPGSPPNGPTTAWEVTSFTVMKVGVPMEFNLLRRYDQMNRIRNDASATIELVPPTKKKIPATPDPAATTPDVEPPPSKRSRMHFSATYRYLTEAYDENFYGRTSNLFTFLDAQFSYSLLNGTFFFVSYARETNRYGYRDVAHLLPNPPAPPGAIVQGVLAQFPTANTWERTSRSSLDSFELGINAAPQQGKMQVDISYALSYARDRISTVNPFTVRADSVLHAGANPYPDTVVRRHDVNVAISRKIKEGLDVGLRYWYEPYKQDDFSFNLMQPYTPGTLTSDTPKYLFQDARYASYHSNVFSVFLRYSFGANP